jgi:hypothetical protein
MKFVGAAEWYGGSEQLSDELGPSPPHPPVPRVGAHTSQPRLKKAGAKMVNLPAPCLTALPGAFDITLG